jgi:membrane-associated protease RseP (regulator of RpoE activity)
LEQQKSSRKVRAEVKFPLILIHTPYGLSFFDKIARTRPAKFYAKFNIYLMPLITALAIFLIVGSMMVLFSNGVARAGVRDAGPQSNLLIPGLNPYLPWTYGWIALVITIIVHEAGHGIVARIYGIKVESTGLVLILGIPIGAFVNIEREELARTPLKQKSAVLTAGPMNNMILAGLCLLGLYLIVSNLTVLPVTGVPKYGVQVLGVGDGTIAKSIGLVKGSIIQNIDGTQVKDIQDLTRILKSNLGTSVIITWKDEKGTLVTHAANLPKTVEPDKGVLGVTITNVAPDPKMVLNRYKAAFGSNPIALLLPPTMVQGSVPYSDLMASKYSSSILGETYPIFSNFLFWLWFVNFNVGIFNALPIGPLDGGQLYNSLIEEKLKTRTKRLKNASLILSAVMTAIVVASFLLPWVFR